MVDSSNTLKEITALVAELRAELRSLSERVAQLEQPAAAAPAAAAAASPAAPAPATAASAAPAQTLEDDLLAISAAVAAYLGVRARIRHVRLIQSSSWAQVGRATVHASHRVH